MFSPEVRFRKWANLMSLLKKEIGRYPVLKSRRPPSDNSDEDLMERYAENSLLAEPDTICFYEDLCAKGLTGSTNKPGWKIFEYLFCSQLLMPPPVTQKYREQKGTSVMQRYVITRNFTLRSCVSDVALGCLENKSNSQSKAGSLVTENEQTMLRERGRKEACGCQSQTDEYQLQHNAHESV
ncbi:hypothetical protein MJG53_011056 [Ovis ammon polii x Ovis aries]|uniref:Uncharacterized protein n=1 Tax=Ovis ammon polii x Ovis aries TaxID=2918886 RepID=A0ACB9US90_9CETA|nr:hypothetical protein MJG53_011056 [Ovis ammon polii x Ovis aries]